MLAYLSLIASAVVWGLGGPLIRWSELSTPEIAFIRFTAVVLVSLVWIKAIERKVLVAPTSAILLVSTLHVFGTFTYILAFFFTSISQVLLVIYTRPLLATLLSKVATKEHISIRQWILLFTAFLGVAIIVSVHPLSLANRDLIGMLLAFLSAIFVALMWMIVKQHGYTHYSQGHILLYQNLVGAGVMLLWASLFPIWKGSSSGIALGLTYAVLTGFGGSLLYFIALKRLTLVRSMPLTYLELLVAVICGYFFFGEALSVQVIIGGILIIGSALLNLRAV